MPTEKREVPPRRKKKRTVPKRRKKKPALQRRSAAEKDDDAKLLELKSGFGKDGKLSSPELHDLLAQVYGLSSYQDAHKAALQFRKEGRLVDTGERVDDVTPVFIWKDPS